MERGDTRFLDIWGSLDAWGCWTPWLTQLGKFAGLAPSSGSHSWLSAQKLLPAVIKEPWPSVIRSSCIPPTCVFQPLGHPWSLRNLVTILSSSLTYFFSKSNLNGCMWSVTMIWDVATISHDNLNGLSLRIVNLWLSCTSRGLRIACFYLKSSWKIQVQPFCHIISREKGSFRFEIYTPQTDWNILMLFNIEQLFFENRWALEGEAFGRSGRITKPFPHCTLTWWSFFDLHDYLAVHCPAAGSHGGRELGTEMLFSQEPWVENTVIRWQQFERKNATQPRAHLTVDLSTPTSCSSPTSGLGFLSTLHKKPEIKPKAPKEPGQAAFLPSGTTEMTLSWGLAAGHVKHFAEIMWESGK